MKRFVLPSILILALIFTVSCSSDDDDDLGPNDNPTSITYTNTIKAIIDGNCTGCHGNPTSNGAPMSLVSKANVQDAISNRNLIGRVENGSMPPNGTLSSTQINALKSWRTANFPN